MKMLALAVTVAVVSAAALVACGGAPQSSGSESSSSDPSPSASPKTYSLTIVRRQPDGSVTQKVQWLTEAQWTAQRDDRFRAKAAWKAGEKLPLTSIDSSCGIDDVAFWQEPDAGGTAELCLAGAGSFDLGTEVTPSWAETVRSYDGAAGDDNNGNCNGESGYFAEQYEDGVGWINCGQGFSCNGGLTNATLDGCAYLSEGVVLTN